MKSSLINTITIVFILASGIFVVRQNSATFDSFLQKTIPLSHTPNTFPEPLTRIDTKTLAHQTASNETVSNDSALNVSSGATTPRVTSESMSVSGIISETNKQRAQFAEYSLTENTELDSSAQIKADDILKRQYFEHTAPDGRTVTDLVHDQKYSYIKIGENLALGNFKDSADVVQAWMNSPGHRANILDKEYTEIGVGVAHGVYQGYQVFVLVQHFGRPVSDCPAIDSGLKAQVDAGEASLASLSTKLDNLKKSIDEGRAEFKNMDSIVTIYNQGVEQYSKQFASVDALRVAYNKQVAVFNDCAK